MMVLESFQISEMTDNRKWRMLHRHGQPREEEQEQKKGKIVAIKVK